MICCFLLWSGACQTPEEALDMYARHRSQPTFVTSRGPDGEDVTKVIYRGVDQASQVRWVKLWARLIGLGLTNSLPELTGLRASARKLTAVLIHRYPASKPKPYLWFLKWGLDKDGGGQVTSLCSVTRSNPERELLVFPAPRGAVHVQRETRIDCRDVDRKVCVVAQLAKCSVC